MLKAEENAKFLTQKMKMAKVTCKHLEECSKEVENFNELREELVSLFLSFLKTSHFDVSKLEHMKQHPVLHKLI